MRRRQFIGLVGSAAATWPLAARAQQGASPRVGYLRLAPASQSQAEENAFLDGLRELGYVDGKNIQIEYRSTEGDESRIERLMRELVAEKVDVLVVHATGTVAAFNATKTIPIVMAVGPDLVSLGLAESLAHPGGNVTGSTFFLAEILAKRLELLKEITPSMSRAGLLLIRRSDGANTNIDAVYAAAKMLNVEVSLTAASGPGDFAQAFAAWADAKVGGIVMGDHTLLTYNAGSIAALAAQHRMSSVGPLSLPKAGGLIGYGVDFLAIFRRAAYFVDQIFKGAKPGDIPIEQPTKFITTVNLKTAKSLGVTVPTALLLRADEVIE